MDLNYVYLYGHIELYVLFMRNHSYTQANKHYCFSNGCLPATSLYTS